MADEAIRYVVLLRKPEQLDPHALAEALARHRGCPTLDAVPAARSCWGILGEGQDESAAKDEAAALTAAGFAALALPRNLLEDPAPPAPVVKGELGEEKPAFCTAAGERLPVVSPILLCATVIKRSVTQTIKVQKDIGFTDKALQVGLLMATGLPIRTSRLRKEEDKIVVTSELQGVLDLILTAPSRRLRVLSDDFDYSCLKEEKTYDTLSNFRLLARRLAGLWPEAGRNRGLSFILAGKPQRDMGYESLADLERETRWLLTLRAIRP
ncbi:MAG: hypothetical protein NTY77_19955 [Elusimicrobia bacterium]|nr:hypothetical protein [Elusimicrobiota bacterium]